MDLVYDPQALSAGFSIWNPLRFPSGGWVGELSRCLQTKVSVDFLCRLQCQLRAKENFHSKMLLSTYMALVSNTPSSPQRLRQRTMDARPLQSRRNACHSAPLFRGVGGRGFPCGGDNDDKLASQGTPQSFEVPRLAMGRVECLLPPLCAWRNEPFPWR